MKNTQETNHWIKTHGDLALDLIRMYLGLGLIIKAFYFMTHSEYLLQYLDNMGSLWIAPTLIAHYVVLAHFVGGFCLLLGFLTRTAALVQLPILFSALFYVHLPNMVKSVESRQSAEFAGLVLFVLALISVYGAGRWSVDHWLGKREFEKLFEPTPSPAK